MDHREDVAETMYMDVAVAVATESTASCNVNASSQDNNDLEETAVAATPTDDVNGIIKIKTTTTIPPHMFDSTSALSSFPVIKKENRRIQEEDEENNYATSKPPLAASTTTYFISKNNGNGSTTKTEDEVDNAILHENRATTFAPVSGIMEEETDHPEFPPFPVSSSSEFVSQSSSTSFPIISSLPAVTTASSPSLTSAMILDRKISVTSDRKHALLLQARHERNAWIRRVPLPFDHSHYLPRPCRRTEEDNDDPLPNNDPQTRPGHDEAASRYNHRSRSSIIIRKSSSAKLARKFQSQWPCTAALLTSVYKKEHDIHVPAASNFSATLVSNINDFDYDCCEDEDDNGDSDSLWTLAQRIEHLQLGTNEESVNEEEEENDDNNDDTDYVADDLNADAAESKRDRSVAASRLDYYGRTQRLPLRSDVSNEEAAYCRDYQRAIVRPWKMDPRYAVIVQGMRRFCGTLTQVSDRTRVAELLVSYAASTSAQVLTIMVQQTTTSTTKSSHITGTFKTKTCGTKNKTNNKSNHPRPVVEAALVQRAVEAFLYGQCQSHVESFLWTRQAQQQEEEWMARLRDFQFVTPQHLEIACFAPIKSMSTTMTNTNANALLNTNENTSLDWNIDDWLYDAIQEMASIDAYFSPYDKLQRILAMYRQVNVALARAINHHRHITTTSTTTTSTTAITPELPVLAVKEQSPAFERLQQQQQLPSADDILPTIILTVLKGQPKRLMYNLSFIEAFALPEYLRGEAGYAFTNLYGAVQFLLQLDLDHTDMETESSMSSSTLSRSGLSISAQEFCTRIQASRNAAAERHQQQMQKHLLERQSRGTMSSWSQQNLNDNDTEDWVEVDLSPVDLRLAKERGETVDVEWALKWYANHQETQQSSKLDGLRPPLQNRPLSPPFILSDKGATMTDFPSGFSRSYSFLNTRPDDVKFADLPMLLEEYKMLVHTTEVLLAEKVTRLRKEKKALRREKEKELHKKIEEINPSLLLSTNSQKFINPTTSCSLNGNADVLSNGNCSIK